MMNFVVKRKDVAIQVYSTKNENIDCVFFVDEANADKTKSILKKAIDEWFYLGGDKPYEDWLKEELDNEDISYDVFFVGG